MTLGNAIGLGLIVIEKEMAGANCESASFSESSRLADVEPHKSGFTGIVSRHFLENGLLLGTFTGSIGIGRIVKFDDDRTATGHHIQ
jgi:hypothetical protein